MSGVYTVDIGDQTPSAGPWTLKGGPYNERYINNANGLSIIVEVEFYPYVTSNDADLYLMAAAPDLLDALEWVESTGMCEHGGGGDMIRAAINKAKGLTK